MSVLLLVPPERFDSQSVSLCHLCYVGVKPAHQHSVHAFLHQTITIIYYCVCIPIFAVKVKAK